MKKIFTLIATVAMAASVNAQGTWAIAAGDEFTAGQQITTVENITMTIAEDAGPLKTGKATSNWADADFTAYTYGDISGKFTEGSEPSGCRYIFEPKVDGTVTVGIQINANKTFYIVDKDNNAVTDFTANVPAEAGGESQTLTSGGSVPAKSNGTVTFKVAAGGKYHVLCTGSKVGIFGFKFVVDGTTAISSLEAAKANADGATFNLAGQKVGKGYEGIVVKNGKKYVQK